MQLIKLNFVNYSYCLNLTEKVIFGLSFRLNIEQLNRVIEITVINISTVSFTHFQ